VPGVQSVLAEAAVLEQVVSSGTEGADQVGDECSGFGGEDVLTPGVVADLHAIDDRSVTH
jgi:hypothetical protein